MEKASHSFCVCSLKGFFKMAGVFSLQNIFIAFSRHHYGKTEWDVALKGKQKSAKYFSKTLLLTTSISQSARVLEMIDWSIDWS